MGEHSIAGRIVMARKKAGYSQKDFAAAIRVGAVTLNRYEKGTRTPDSMLLSTMLIYLDCDAEWLLTGMAPEGTERGEVPPRFPNKEPRSLEDETPPKLSLAKDMVDVNTGKYTKDEQEYCDKLVDVLRNPHTKKAIQENIDTFLKVPGGPEKKIVHEEKKLNENH